MLAVLASAGDNQQGADHQHYDLPAWQPYFHRARLARALEQRKPMARAD